MPWYVVWVGSVVFLVSKVVVVIFAVVSDVERTVVPAVVESLPSSVIGCKVDVRYSVVGFTLMSNIVVFPGISEDD